MRMIMKTAGRVLCVLSVTVLIATGVMFITGSKPAVVMSGSMEPTIETGSLLLIDTRFNELENNDIVAFETGGALVVHRLVKETEEGWITKGDANKKEDPWRINNDNIKLGNEIISKDLSSLYCEFIFSPR